MDITLIRHTTTNIKKGFCYGQTNVGLASSFDLEQTKIALELKSQTFDTIYSSPLFRCRNLAEVLFPNKNLILDKRLMEINFGNWEGQNWDEIYKTDNGKAFFDNYIEKRCPNGESYLDLINRVSSFYNDIKKQDSNKKIAIVTHGGTIRAFLCIIAKISPIKAFERNIEYGEILKLTN